MYADQWFGRKTLFVLVLRENTHLSRCMSFSYCSIVNSIIIEGQNEVPNFCCLLILMTNKNNELLLLVNF